MIKFNLVKLENHLAFQILELSTEVFYSIQLRDHLLIIYHDNHGDLSEQQMNFKGSYKVHYTLVGLSHILSFNDNNHRDESYDIILKTIRNGK